MKFPSVRGYIKSKGLNEPYVLQDCELVIDAQSFFKNSYKESGCQFVLGPDCDLYADYLIKKLTCFLDCGIKCYVIFKGSSKCDLEKILAKQQKIIDDRRDIKLNLHNPKYFDPLLVNDVQKQVLQEMDIKYFCCEHDSMEAIVSVARALKCPVLTDNVEYCLYKVSCISLNSVNYEEGNTKLKCAIYKYQKIQALFGVYNKAPLLLTVLSKNKELFNKIPDLSWLDNNYLPPVIRWVKRQHKDLDVTKNLDDENTRKAFMEMYEKINILYLYRSNNLALKYFRRDKAYRLFKDDKKWFSKGVSDGRIGLPYVDIKLRGLLLGSKTVNAIYKPDAVLAAYKIIAYNYKLLTNSRGTTLNFIGRKLNSSSMWEIDTDWSSEINNRELFFKPKIKSLEIKKVYTTFFKGIRPGHDLINELMSDTQVPKQCWILIITLVFYIENVNKNFIDGAYFIILSYLVLGPVSKTLQLQKKGEIDVNSTIYTDAQKMYYKFRFLFRVRNWEHQYDSCILHSLAEFTHCLQHMNFLNNICGQGNNVCDIPSTVYHKSYNATFIYNLFLHMKDKDRLMKYLREHCYDSVFFEKYKNITSRFEKCRHG